MARKKVQLAWIVNDTARNASMRKRKQGLIKKVGELAILCGVHASIVIFGVNNEVPAVWPCRSTVQQLMQRYYEAPDTERGKKTTTQESYLTERVAKLQDQLKKQNKKNQELESDIAMFKLSRGTQLNELSSDDLINLFWITEQKIKEVQKKIMYFKQLPPLAQPPEPAPCFPVAENSVSVDPVKQTENNFSAVDQWFINMMMNSNDVPGSSRASVYGGNASVFGGSGFGGLAINGATEPGFPNHGGFNVCNCVEPTKQFPPEFSYYNGGQKMNQVNPCQPQENCGVNLLGGLVNGGLGGTAADVGGGFSWPEIEEHGGGDAGGNHLALDWPNELNNIEFLVDDDESDINQFLQDPYEDNNNGGGDLTLPGDSTDTQDHISPP